MRARLRTRWAVLLSVGACLAVAMPSPASAQDQPQTVQVPPKIVAVDARANTNATVIVRSTDEIVDPKVIVNKTPVEVTSVKKALDAGTKINTVLVIDNSEDSGTFAFKEIKSAAANFLSSLQPGESVAVVSLGGTARIEKELNKNPEVTAQIVNDLKPVGATELWSGFTLAADILASESTAVNNVIALVASQDSGANAKVAAAISGSLSSRVAVNVIALRSSRVSDSQVRELSQLAQETGGLMQATTQPSLLPPLFSAASNAVHGLYAVGIIGDPLAPGGNLSMLVNGTQLDVGFIAGSVTRGANLAPFKESKPVLPFLQTGKGKLLALVMMFSAIALGIWAIGTSVVRENTGLNSALSPYVDSVEGGDVVGRHSALFQRAVDITGGIAERRGFLTSAENKLDQASMPLRAAEALTLYAVFIGVVFLGSIVLTRNPIKILILTVIGGLLPSAYVNFKISRRKKKFMNQLPDTLGLLAGTLKAGYSFMQGVGSGFARSRGSDGRRAAPGRQRSPARPAGRRRARVGRGAHGERRLRLGRHGRQDPARGRRQSRRVVVDRGRDDDVPFATEGRDQGAHRRRSHERDHPRHLASWCRSRHVRAQQGVHGRALPRVGGYSDAHSGGGEHDCRVCLDAQDHQHQDLRL
jgi:tight adherence protein B